MGLGRLRPLPLTACTVAAVLLARPAAAYRPFDGTDADTAELGSFELELGPLNYYRQASRNYLLAPDLVLNFGLLPNTELVLDASQEIALGTLPKGDHRDALLGDDVLVKHIFREGTLQEKTGPSVAAEGGVLTPEVNGVNGVGASLDVITSYRWPFGTVHWNEWFEYTRAHDADLFTGFILEGPADWRVRPVAELYFAHDFAGGSTGSALVGAIWTVRESFALDAGLRGARIGGTSAAEARLGFTWAIAMWEPEKPAVRD